MCTVGGRAEEKRQSKRNKGGGYRGREGGKEERGREWRWKEDKVCEGKGWV